MILNGTQQQAKKGHDVSSWIAEERNKVRASLQILGNLATQHESPEVIVEVGSI